MLTIGYNLTTLIGTWGIPHHYYRNELNLPTYVYGFAEIAHKQTAEDLHGADH